MKPRRLIPAALLATVLAGPAAAQAAPVVAAEYLTGTAKPGHMVLDPDGNVWTTITDGGGANDVLKVTPTGTVTPVDILAGNFTGASGIALGPDGNIYLSSSGKVAKFKPSDPTVASKFDVAGLNSEFIAFGSDGNLWAADNDKVRRIKPDGSDTQAFTPTGLTQAKGLSLGPDGNLYTGDQATGKVFRVKPDGTTTDFDTAPGLFNLFASPNGQVVFASPVSSPEKMGIYTAPGPAKVINVENIDPNGIALGLDGAYWVANFGGASLTRMTTTGETSPLTGFSANAGTRWVIAGHDGTLWVSEENKLAIAKVTGLEAPKVDTPGGGGTGTTTTTTTGTTPPPPPDTTKPVISKLSVTKVLKRKKTSTIKLTSSEAGLVKVDIQLAFPGRRHDGRTGKCVAPSKANRKNRRCDHFYSQKKLKATMTGTNATLTFKRALLPKGRYRIVVTVTDAAGNASAQKIAAFTATRK